MSWNPDQYLQYEDARLRPALELLARVPLQDPRVVVDLGCGAGNVTRVLASRWPASRLVGVDGDPAMLDKARNGGPVAEWIRADIGTWRPDVAPDVLYSNAVLHWLDDHARLFPRLAQHVSPGGVLAVQMPDNFGAASHRALFSTARSAPWRDRLLPLVREAPVAAPEQYVEWLEPFVGSVDAWRTEYLQVLAARTDGEHPVVAWMRGAALTPFLAALGEAEQEAFVSDFRARIEDAYPRRRDARVFFPFRRLFMVAQR